LFIADNLKAVAHRSLHQVPILAKSTFLQLLVSQEFPLRFLRSSRQTVGVTEVERIKLSGVRGESLIRRRF
jgi:hypothetical protein